MNVPWRLLNKQVKLEKKNAAMIVFFRIICYSRKKQMSRQLIWFVIMKFDSTGTSVLFRLISRQCVSCSAPFSFPGILACVVDHLSRCKHKAKSPWRELDAPFTSVCHEQAARICSSENSDRQRQNKHIHFTRCANIIHILVWNNGHTLCLRRAVLHAILLISYFAVLPLHPSSLSLLYKGNAIWHNL